MLLVHFPNLVFTFILNMAEAMKFKNYITLYKSRNSQKCFNLH